MVWWAIIFSTADPSGNGTRPVRAKYSTHPRLYWSPAGVRLVGSMMLSGLAQSSPLVSVFAVDIVSTRLSPSFSTSSEPMPKSRIRAWLSDPIMMFDGFTSPWNRLFWWATVSPWAICTAYRAAWFGSSLPFCWTMASSVCPSASGHDR